MATKRKKFFQISFGSKGPLITSSIKAGDISVPNLPRHIWINWFFKGHWWNPHPLPSKLSEFTIIQKWRTDSVDKTQTGLRLQETIWNLDCKWVWQLVHTDKLGPRGTRKPIPKPKWTKSSGLFLAGVREWHMREKEDWWLLPWKY